MGRPCGGDYETSAIERESGRSDGASAVEFALVVPVLLLLVFGIIEYGLWFSDSARRRQGVREAARQGVVGNFGTESCDLTGASGDANAQALMCTAQDRIGGITGDPAIMVDGSGRVGPRKAARRLLADEGRHDRGHRSAAERPDHSD